MNIKETREVLVAVNELAVFLVERLKDGVGFDDVAAIYDKLKNDEDFKTKMQMAYDNIALVPDEVEDIDIAEGVELATVQLSYVPKYIEALKKEASL